MAREAESTVKERLLSHGLPLSKVLDIIKDGYGVGRVVESKTVSENTYGIK